MIQGLWKLTTRLTRVMQMKTKAGVEERRLREGQEECRVLREEVGTLRREVNMLEERLLKREMRSKMRKMEDDLRELLRNHVSDFNCLNEAETIIDKVLSQ